ncbi:hypothetical protein KRX51_03715 [Corynebacterium sp. TAE3-ERU12]|uniref:hypothetical protein n=1 Tax=Corynebacterium sp. TAE3-ERU12 TaxID=2849491 RepID=UPI001C451FDA|nr:hypothetical protein [Corynebacterium sp. TAE3-ERU12]MBV7295024.1 hypothetical protein [Corynebacterium sp. TAE3-ERU12]
MRHRLPAAIAALALASAGLVACSPPNEQDSDITVGDQEATTDSYKQDMSTTPSDDAATDGELQDSTSEVNSTDEVDSTSDDAVNEVEDAVQ